MKVLLVVACCFLLLHFVKSSCLNVLDANKCANIQKSGQQLANLVKEADNIIQELVYRCIEESQLIIESSMKYLKQESLKVKVNNPGTTPIETDKLKKVSKELLTIAVRSIQDGNRKFWHLLTKSSKLLLQDDTVAKALLSYSTSSRVKRTTASMNSLDGKIQSLNPEMKNILMTVDLNLKAASKKIFDLFADSLKMLLQGKIQTDLDQAKMNLEEYLTDSIVKLIDSIMQRSLMVLKESTQQIEIIDVLVDNVKTDPQKLAQAMNPARELVLEVLEATQKVDDDEEIERKLKQSISLIQIYFHEIKKSITL